MTKDTGYTAKDIQVLEGLEAVRKRPAMYIGSTNRIGLHHLVYEVLDNSIDEALAGYCRNIHVQLYKDGSVSVTDDGRGIPVDKHDSGKSALEVVLTVLHAGGKFGKQAYAVSGGLHGVGVSVVNALSETLSVEVHRDGKLYAQAYNTGIPTSDVEVIGDTNRTGTTIRFKPNTKIFETVEFEYNYLKERIMELAFLNAGLRIRLSDERDGTDNEFYYEGGIKEFVEHINKARTKLHEPVYSKKTKDNNEIEYALQYTDSYSESIYSFVNNIKTIDGGTHVSGFRTALTRVVNEYMRINKALKNDKKISGDDAIEGLIGIISIKIPEPQFEGQTKAKLGNSEIKGIVDSVVYDSLMTYLEEHPTEAKRIMQKIISSMEAREAAQKAKELIRRKSVFESSILPGKLSDCIEKDPSKCEIFVVEGDSAGGSGRQGRDRNYQAILPLKGKILNVEKAPMHKVLTSEEIKAIVLSIGAGFGEDFDATKARYHKFVIMSVDYEEPTVVMEPDGTIKLVKIGKFVDDNLGNGNINNHKVLCFDVKTNKTTFKPLKKVIRHEISEPLFEIKTRYGRVIKVTSSHSLFAYKNGKIILKKTSELKKGDSIVAPSYLPLHGDQDTSLDLLEEFSKIKKELDVDFYIRGTKVFDVWKRRVLDTHAREQQLVESRVEISPDFREEIKNTRMEMGFSQIEICNAIGVMQPTTFYSWEKGANTPTLSHFKKYIKLLGFEEEKIKNKIRVLPSKLEQIWEMDFKNSRCNIVKDRIRLKELKETDLEIIGNENVRLSPTHYAHKTVNRFVPINEDLMFVLGLFVAEGSCSQRNGVRFAIGNSNMRFAEDLKRSLEKLFGVDAKLYFIKNRAAEVKILNSVVSASFRYVFGFNNVDSSSKRIPNIVFNSPKELQLAFLKGYLFGDGTVSKRGIHFSTVSKELANDILYLLLANNIMASLSISGPDGKVGTIRNRPIIRRLDSYRISIVNKEDIIKLEKVWKEHHIAGRLKERMESKNKIGKNRAFTRISDDLIALPIISKKEIQPTKRMVYDFSVEADENFIAGFGALAAHNTDADVDGAHIRTLILTLFYRHFKPLIEKGYLYIAQPPLYKIKRGKNIQYAYSDQQLEEMTKGISERAEIQRYKGLGEMNPEQLWETTMNPETRTLKQVTIEDAIVADELFTILMGDEVAPRKEFIEQYAKQVKNLDI